VNRIGFVFGMAFGAFISAGRLNEYATIHNGLRLQDFYMFLSMGSAVAVAMPVLWLLRRRAWTTPLGGPLELTPAKVERKYIYGGLTFGTGWAIAGTCPAPALSMVGAGGVMGVFVVLGLFGGIMLRDRVVERASGKIPVERGRTLKGREFVHTRARANASLDL
jgi:uncharacterized membrane protein YedE/YeeE